MGQGITLSHRHRAGDEVTESLAPFQAAVERLAADGLDDASARRLAIVVEELVANVIRHAAHQRDISLTLILECEESRISMILEDDSDPFDPRSYALPERPNPDHGGGVGLALVRAWADIVSYDRCEGRNRLALRLLAPGGQGG